MSGTRDGHSAGQVGILGGGSWGTVLAHLAAQVGCDTRVWMRDEQRAEEVNTQRTNSRYLGDHQLSEGIRATTDMEEVLAGADLILFALPSKVTRELAGEAGAYITGDQVVLSATKGFEPQTYARMSEVIRAETCARKVGALHGPNLAKEILSGQPSATVVASRYREAISLGAQLLHGPGFRIYGNMDLRGVELAGALKNVIAIASGTAHGLGFGANVRALIVTRGLAEIQRLGVKLGADPLTFSGLAGIGDLMVTCGSELSRNFRVGLGLAAGKDLDTILAGLGETAEGVNTTRAALALAEREDVSLPIIEGIAQLLFDGATPKEIMHDLMTRVARFEIDFEYSADIS